MTENKSRPDKSQTSSDNCKLEECSALDPYLAQLPDVVDAIVESLNDSDSTDHVGRPMVPSRESLQVMVELFERIAFPGYFGTQEVDKANIGFYLGSRVHRLYRILAEQIIKCLRHECSKDDTPCCNCEEQGRVKSLAFLKKIPTLRRKLALDVKAAFMGDPAARSFEEIIFSYPGIRAVSIFRFAHELWDQGIPIIPRMLTEYAHSLTGCDIHPGATIGDSFFIDHATGVVIGETAHIGRNVRVYQGVTLGGLSYRADKSGRLVSDQKRHPTLEDDVVVYAGATILGGQTVVGKGSMIGGNVWLTQSVLPGSKVLHSPRIEVRGGTPGDAKASAAEKKVATDKPSEPLGDGESSGTQRNTKRGGNGL